MKEVTAPEGYTLPTPAQQEITTKGNETVVVTFEDVKKTTEVKVRKEDLDTGKPLAGAYFILYDEQGKQLEDGISNEDGILLFTKVEAGKTYFIEEKTPPVGYEPANPNKKQVTTKAGETASVVFQNKQIQDDSKLRILKLDQTTKLPLVGAFFEIRTLDGTLVSSGTSNTNGTLTPSGLEAGKTYRVKEVRPPKGYLLPVLNEKEVKIIEGETTIVTFEDIKEEQAIVIIKKLDKITLLPLAGATFELYHPNGQFLERGISQADGTITFSGLEAGKTYIVKEVIPPPDYELSLSALQQVTVKAGETAIITFYNNRKPDDSDLRILKIDEETQVPLEGAYFELFDKAGKKIESGYSKADGSLSFSQLEVGHTYTIREVTPPKGYLLPDQREQQITPIKGKTITIIFRDRKKKLEETMLQIRKEDQQNGRLLAGAVFQITNQQGFSLFVTTPESGIAIVKSLQPGEYQIEETITPNGYALSKPIKQSILLLQEQSLLVSFQNQPLEPGEGEFFLTKVDAETRLPLQGVVFSILDAKKKEHTRGITDQNGLLKISLPEGNYYYQEIRTAEEYQIDDKLHPFTIRKGESITVTAINTKKQGQLILRKVDSVTKETLKGAVFVIYDEKETEIMRQTSDKSGICRFFLPFGTYYYEEVSAPSLYVSSKGRRMFQISEHNQAITEIVPNRKEKGDGILILSKIDFLDGTVLPDCTFLILNEKKEEIQRGVTDDKGNVSMLLPKGSYFYQEIEAPEGYLVNTTPHPFMIEEDGQVIRKTITNLKREQPSIPPENPGGTLHITKQDINDSSIQLPNTKITICSKETGEVVMKQRTNEQGIAEFTLPVGKYTYQESEAPEGYLLDNTICDFEIRENGEILKAVMVDTKIPEFWLLKVDAETGQPIKGCSFRITNSEKKEITQGVTGVDGYYKTKLLPGVYYYEETEAALGYEKNSMIQRIQVKEGDRIIERKVTNKKKPGSVDLPKTGDTIEALSDGTTNPVFMIGKVILVGGITIGLLFAIWKRKKKHEH